MIQYNIILEWMSAVFLEWMSRQRICGLHKKSERSFLFFDILNFIAKKCEYFYRIEILTDSRIWYGVYTTLSERKRERDKVRKEEWNEDCCRIILQFRFFFSVQSLPDCFQVDISERDNT